MTQSEPINYVQPEDSYTSLDLFLEIRSDLIGHIGNKAIEDFKHK